MTLIEKETTVNFNESDDPATVETYNKALLNRLEKLSSAQPDACRLVYKPPDGSYARYAVPKKWVKISPPKKVSDEQREAMRQRAQTLSRQKQDSDDEP